MDLTRRRINTDIKGPLFSRPLRLTSKQLKGATALVYLVNSSQHVGRHGSEAGLLLGELCVEVGRLALALLKHECHIHTVAFITNVRLEPRWCRGVY